MKKFIYGALALLLVSTGVAALDELEIGSQRSPDDLYNWRIMDESLDKLQDQGIFLSISSVATATSAHVVAPFGCEIERWYLTVRGEVTSATEFRLYIATTPNTTGLEVGPLMDTHAGRFAYGGSNRITFNTTDDGIAVRKFATVTDTNVVLQGDVISFDTDGGTTYAAPATATIVCRR